jgi:hypothetical protein
MKKYLQVKDKGRMMNEETSRRMERSARPWERWRPAGEFRVSAPNWPAGRRRSQEDGMTIWRELIIN